MTTEKGKRIQSLESGFAILKVIAEAKKPMTLQELANETNFFKSQLYRYLNSFVHMGVLHRSGEDSPRWTLGAELISLGSAAFEAIDIAREAQSALINLRNQVDETVALSIWREKGPFIVRWESSKKLVNIGLNTGSYVPLFTATGKVFRAFLPQEKTQRLYEEEIKNENINPELFNKYIEQVRESKLSISHTESKYIPGIIAISVPIFYSNNMLAGAMSIIGVPIEKKIEPHSEIVKSLFSAAQSVSERLG